MEKLFWSPAAHREWGAPSHMNSQSSEPTFSFAISIKKKIDLVEAECADFEGGVKGIVLNVAESDRVVDGEIEQGIDRSAQKHGSIYQHCC